jgi:lysyl-tRNA synthetase, class II
VDQSSQRIQQNQLIQQRLEKARDLEREGVDLYPNHFVVSHTTKEVNGLIEQRDGATDGTVFSMAGRIVGLRSFGKAAFFHFRDGTGKLQVYVKRDEVGKQIYGQFKKFDVGDFVGVKGSLFQTKTGEWTLLAKEISLLCKAVRPLPEKFHGLKDPEKRYRQRYLDLIMNEDVRALFVKRARIIQAFRGFLLERGFLEVETPMMQPIPGGAEATPFKTHHNALGIDLFLRIAPELYLKRLIVGGFDRVFEVNRNFRNEGISTRHNPEFTMLEFYVAYATHEDLMDLTQEMFRFVAHQVLGKAKFLYQGNEISLDGPWRRLSLRDALSELGGVDPSLFDDRTGLLAFAAANDVKVTKVGKCGKILTKLFDALVEPQLIEPTFIVDYPVEVSPLAKRKKSDPEVTERFELFIGGSEIANGFSELNDPVDQRKRFMGQVAERQDGDVEAHHMDEDFVKALEYGMPPTAGEGIGIDRFVMLLTNAPSIREVILFPLLKEINP